MRLFATFIFGCFLGAMFISMDKDAVNLVFKFKADRETEFNTMRDQCDRGQILVAFNNGWACIPGKGVSQ